MNFDMQVGMDEDKNVEGSHGIETGYEHENADSLVIQRRLIGSILVAK